MTRLAGIVVTSPDVARLRDFYERGLGLAPAHAEGGTVEYATGAAVLALEPGTAPTMRLRFVTPDFDARVATLRQRTGAALEAAGKAGARRVTTQAPGGLAIELAEGAVAEPAGVPALTFAILESDDLDAELRFWREALGLRLAEEGEHALTLEAGDASVAVHQRGAGTGPPLHPDQRVAFALEWADLDAVADAVRERGFALATAPSEEAFGRFAEIEDPDGMIVVLRGPGVEDPIEEVLAEDWADDDDDDDGGAGGRRLRERENPGARRVAKPASQQRQQQRRAAEKAGTQAFEAVVRGRAPGRGNYPASDAAPRPPRPTTPGEGAGRALDDARRGGLRPSGPRPAGAGDRRPPSGPRPAGPRPTGPRPGGPRPPRRDER